MHTAIKQIQIQPDRLVQTPNNIPPLSKLSFKFTQYLAVLKHSMFATALWQWAGCLLRRRLYHAETQGTAKLSGFIQNPYGEGRQDKKSVLFYD